MSNRIYVLKVKTGTGKDGRKWTLVEYLNENARKVTSFVSGDVDIEMPDEDTLNSVLNQLPTYDVEYDMGGNIQKAE